MVSFLSALFVFRYRNNKRRMRIRQERMIVGSIIYGKKPY